MNSKKKNHRFQNDTRLLASVVGGPMTTRLGGAAGDLLPQGQPDGVQLTFTSNKTLFAKIVITVIQ